MSLHKFAEQVAQHGRGDDSLLVHMTPDEVRKLQQFAEANGTTLTINPHTGLPEAGLLSDFFKMVAPVALGAFLGPAGMGLTIGGLSSAATAGLLTGGITTLATGSLSRGLMAGLGAYGGAGLGEGLANAGAASMGTSASLGAGIPADMAFNLADAGVEGAANIDAASKAIAQVQPSSFSKMSAGLGSITSSPEALGSFAKDNWKSLAAAATPIMAGSMVPTTTSMPENKNPAYIRQKLYDPYTQTYKSLTPVKASEWGSRSFSDAYTNPQTGEMSTLQPRSPGMASGGIVALADGGFTQDQINAALQAELAARPGTSQADLANYAKSQYGLTDAQINAAYAAQQPAPMTQAAAPAPQAQALQTATTSTTAPAPVVPDASDWWAKQPGGVNALYDYLNNQINTTYKNATDAQIDAAMQKYGISAEDIHNALQKGGGSLAEEYAIGAGNMGLSGLNQNINSWISMANADPTFRNLTPEQKRNRALDAMGTVNMNEADVVRATGKTIAQLFPNTAGVIPTGVYGTYGNNTGNPMTSTPGDIGMNPDGTVTVTPNIPGRPQGGFTGMGQVKDVYTAGGGSLGYTAKAPKTIEEFNQLYNKQTGDSLAAYNYLMGKGANNNAYPVQSQAASTATGIQRPYWSAGMKYKPRYLSYDKEGNVVSSSTSPNAAGATEAKTADLTRAETIEVVDSSGYNTQTYTAVLQPDGTYLAGNGKRYDVSGKELAAGGGMMGYAMGGGLGSLGSYSDGGRLLKGPGDGVSDSIPATIGAKQQPARLADGEFVVPARIVSELGNGSTEAGAKKLYAMMDRVQKARGKTTGKNKVAANTRADKYLPA